MIQAHKIDADGYVTEVIVVDGDDSTLTDDIVIEPMPNGFYKPRWVNGEWIEGKSEEEFLEDDFLSSLQPTQNEVTKAERELEIINLLIELEVI
ncbi:hypothetical protein LYSBPC_24530 [Lysinibacillus piscis]|uniref:Phage protein n=2 Tax=Lysinibacillus piscis TaxID=2518931 RepID=A0ABQ5NLU7_9BACI|nr:hypothetical protein LYSBPC_24530 [Lysinibacillus sp. KH24]